MSAQIGASASPWGAAEICHAVFFNFGRFFRLTLGPAFVSMVVAICTSAPGDSRRDPPAIL
jgi:hypothetical protein